MMEMTAPTFEQLFWVWRNAIFEGRKDKAKWAYDLVKSGRHDEKRTLELLEDLMWQAEIGPRSEAMFVASAHGHASTYEAVQNMGSPTGLIAHWATCRPCLTMAVERFVANKDKYSDKPPFDEK